MDNTTPGRPEYNRTESDAKNVEALVIAGVPQSRIARVLKISEPTLRKHYREELDISKAKANAIVSQALFKSAKDGNVTAQIFWLKTQAGWREKNHLEITGKDGEKLFDDKKQLIEIRRVFDEIGYTEPKNITKPTELVENSKEQPKDS
tara:strand:+ start:214 stop:660 length:447 start_codon:yes stop_codon:yes gene_type:complete